MKLKSIGKYTIFYTKKDGEDGKAKAPEKVIAFAKKVLKKGDIFTAKWDKGKIVKINKFTGKGGRKGGSFGNVPSDERSVLSSVCTLLAGTEGVTVDNVEDKVETLFDLGIKLVKKDTSKKKEKEEEEEEPEEKEPEEEGEEEEETFDEE